MCAVKPTRPCCRDRRRHFRTVQTEHPTAVAICGSFNPSLGIFFDFQAYLIRCRLSSLSHMVSFLLASRLLKKIIVRELRPRRVRLYETLPKRDRYDFMRLDIFILGTILALLGALLVQRIKGVR